MKKQILIPTIALFVICLVATTLLAFANNITEPLIEKNAIETENKSRSEIFQNANFQEKTGNGISYVLAEDENGEAVGMIFTTSAKSYGGDLTVMTGVNMDGTVKKIQILSINDTAGLGMKAQKDDFKSRYEGLVNGIKVAKNSADPSNNEILALTGATVTSNAVTEAVNLALENFNTINQNGGVN